MRSLFSPKGTLLSPAEQEAVNAARALGLEVTATSDPGYPGQVIVRVAEEGTEEERVPTLRDLARDIRHQVADHIRIRRIKKRGEKVTEAFAWATLPQRIESAISHHIALRQRAYWRREINSAPKPAVLFDRQEEP